MSAPIEPWKRSNAAGEEGRAVELFRELGEPAPLAPRAWARIRANVALARPRARRYLPRRMALAVALAVVGGVPLGVALARPAWRWIAQLVAVRGAIEPSPAVSAPPPVAPVPEPTPPAPAVAVVAPRSRPSARPSAGPTPGPEDELLAETALLQTAVQALPADPASALAALERYQRRYPRGALASEARLLEVEAHLGAGQDAEALAVLDGLHDGQLEGSPRGRELQVLRAELLASAGRCGEAVAACDGALGSGAAPALQERALYVRASCRLRLGDGPSGRRDFEEYLERFPSGRFVAAARASLGGK